MNEKEEEEEKKEEEDTVTTASSWGGLSHKEEEERQRLQVGISWVCVLWSQPRRSVQQDSGDGLGVGGEGGGGQLPGKGAVDQGGRLGVYSKEM